MRNISPNKIDALKRAVGLFLLWLAICCVVPSSGWASRTHEAFFQGTDHELHVYRIFGKEPGKTLFLIGGIQGNEPGGFLSADLYADMALAKGNLIVVPRANFYSIIRNRRQINEDMNRQFGKSPTKSYEIKIVTILKELIAESDCLLNLHDGSGFYSPRWEGPMRNPKRYGQSIIADCENYTVKETGKTLHLGDMANNVIVEINKHIEKPEYRFHFNNHRTSDPNTLHPEQRKSATYYALFECGIPAFGIESSKSLPLEMKIRHHNLAINGFMDLLDIVPETPGIYLDPPVMRYVVMAVNGNIPFAIPNGHTLSMRKGDLVRISHVETNYKRGLSADILKHGTWNDIGKPIAVKKPTQVVVRKDHHPCGVINIVLDPDDLQARTVSALPGVLFFETKINGKEQLFMNNAKAKLIRGDRLELVDVTTNQAGASEVVVNFKGYVGDKVNNTGEDRGYVIHTESDLWKRYSLHGEGKTYRVLVTTRDDLLLGQLFVEIEEPKLDYVIIQVNGGVKRCLYPGDSLNVARKDKLNILDIKTNIPTNAGVRAILKGLRTKRSLYTGSEPFPQRIELGKAESHDQSFEIEVQREQAVLGSIVLDFEKGVRHGG